VIRPLRRLHRRIIALVIATLACAFAALLVSAYRAADGRMETLPASLLPAPLLPESSNQPAGRSMP
jgi:hypothetical protein